VSHVVPLTDVEIDVLTCHRNDFSSRGITLCIPSHESVHICRDKWLVYETFKDSPLVRPIPTWKLEDNATHSVPVPLIAKPRTGRSSEGLSRLTTVADLQHCRQKYANSNYILQPLMEGNVCVVDIVRQKRTGRWASMARQELIRTPNGAGLTVRMMDDAVLNDAAYRIADELDINGCINIEFLVHAGQPLLMDINPRFSAGLAFSKLSGYDMAANHFRCFSGQDIDEAIHPLPSIHARHYAEVTMLASDDKSP
jgi:carbamoyl-phosphate synthase large subunit